MNPAAGLSWNRAADEAHPRTALGTHCNDTTRDETGSRRRLGVSSASRRLVRRHLRSGTLGTKASEAR